MRFHRLIATLLLTIPVIAADAPMPDLKVVPEEAGTAFTVKNTYSQPLAAIHIEIVDPPGESYAFTRDELGPNAIAPGTEKTIRVASLVPGTAPDHVKILAAVYQDGAVVGAPDKVKHILDLRRGRLENTREIIQRIEKDQKDGKDKDAIVADLRQWGTTIVPPPPPGMQPITDPAKTVKRNMVVVAAGQVNTRGIDAELGTLKKTEAELAASKPTL
jgi:hypothetical protein